MDTYSNLNSMDSKIVDMLVSVLTKLGCSEDTIKSVKEDPAIVKCCGEEGTETPSEKDAEMKDPTMEGKEKPAAVAVEVTKTESNPAQAIIEKILKWLGR